MPRNCARWGVGTGVLRDLTGRPPTAAPLVEWAEWYGQCTVATCTCQTLAAEFSGNDYMLHMAHAVDAAVARHLDLAFA